MTTAIGPGDDLSTAVQEAADGAVLLLQPGRYVGAIVPQRSVVIRGVGPEPTVLDADATGAVVSVDVDDIEVRLEGVVLTGGSAPVGGGVALLAGSKVTLTDCVVHDCHARQGGGAAVYVDMGTVELERCRIDGGRAEKGAAVHVDQIGEVVARACLFTGAVGAGQALVRVRDGAALTLDASTIAAGGAGFGLHVSGTTSRLPEVVIKDSVVAGAAAALDSSVAPVLRGSVRATRSVFSAAKADGFTDFGGCVIADPQFSGAGSEPYAVKASSPAAALSVTVGTDIVGRVRAKPNATAGAFEL